MTSIGIQQFKPENDHIDIVHNFNFLDQLFVTMQIVRIKSGKDEP